MKLLSAIPVFACLLAACTASSSQDPCREGTGCELTNETGETTSGDDPAGTGGEEDYPIYEYLPLEIYQPRAGLSLANRFYKAYPDPDGDLGIPYRVRAVVAGGAWPYRFELVTAPAGMTIDARTGEINWETPTTVGSPHTVSMRVTDQRGVESDVTWPLAVTTSGFLFVDRVHGQPSTADGGTATGTIDAPWKTMKDVYGGDSYEAKWIGDWHRGAFVYFRTGTYELNTFVEDVATENRVPWTEQRPLVLMAFPGEAPVIVNNHNGFDAHLHFYASEGALEDLYVEGFEIDDNGQWRGKALVASGGGRHIFRNLHIHGATSAPLDNHALLFLTGGAGEYNAVQDCTFSDAPSHYGVLQYGYPKTVFEDLVVTDTHSGFSPKDGNSYFTLRNSVIARAETRAVWTQTYVGQGYTQYNEIHHNYAELTTDAPDIYGYSALLLNHNPNHPHGPQFVYRNTIKGNVVFNNLTTEDGEIVFKDNILLTSTGDDDGINVLYSSDESKIVQDGNVVESYDSPLVDANGRLQGDGLQYLGSKGWELE